MTTPPAMPELPEPELGYIETDKSRQPAFSARQMRAALQAQPAATTTVGAPFGMLRTTCPYCENGFAFEQPAAAASDAEIDAAWVNNGGGLNSNNYRAFARAILALRPQAVPMTDEKAALEEEEFSLLSQTQVAALLWVLWCHQGASSPVGQPIRFALGMDKRQAMSDEQVSAAQRFRIDWHQWSGITAPAGGEKQA